jgi:2-polyprenyl-3-methyl-5-hydroxy-6-metoxy-1,4-benzoquinol methylase
MDRRSRQREAKAPLPNAETGRMLSFEPLIRNATGSREQSTMSLCPVCEAPRHRTLGPHPDFPGHEIVCCRACTMISVDPRPSVDQLAERYRETYRKDAQEYPTEGYFAFMDKRATAQRAFILPHLPIDDTLSVLDIGCSAGSLLSSFGDMTSNLEGYEPDVMMASVARDRLPTSVRIFNELCDPAVLPSDTYDLITLSHVFEHVLEPVEFLRHLLRATRRNGLVFIEVPNEPTSEVMRQVRAPFRSKLHLSYFNPQTLERCAARSGGTAVKIATYGPSAGRFSLVPEEMLRRPAKRTLVTRAYNRIHRTLLPAHRPRWIGSVDLGEYVEKENPSGGVWIRALFSKYR